LIALATGLLALAAAHAAAPPQLAAGMTVLDPSGGTVGVIDSISAGNAVIATGANKVALPVASFAMGEKGPMIGMTKAQLDEAAAKASASMAVALRSQLVPGATINGSQGNSVGTIKAVEGDFLVLTTAKGDARLPVSSVGSGDKGLTIGMTASDLEKAVGASQ
jgi:hypothetical protein